MAVAAVVHGLALSLGLIAALGPQNVFVLQQGAAQPRLRRALPTVVAAGLADTLLIGLGVGGVSLIVLQRPWLRTAMLAGGVVFLLYVGWTLLRASPLGTTGDADPLDARAQAGFAVSVSLLNPHAVLDTVGVIGTSALAYDPPARWAFAAACALVSWLWFAGLAVAGRLLGRSLDPERLRYVDTAAALTVWAVAVYLGWRLLGLWNGG